MLPTICRSAPSACRGSSPPPAKRVGAPRGRDQVARRRAKMARRSARKPWCRARSKSCRTSVSNGRLMARPRLLVRRSRAPVPAPEAVGKDIDHLGILEPLLEGLRAVVEVNVPMEVIGGTPLLEKAAESDEAAVGRIMAVVDVARRGVGDQQIERAAVAKPVPGGAAAPSSWPSAPSPIRCTAPVRPRNTADSRQSGQDQPRRRILHRPCRRDRWRRVGLQFSFPAQRRVNSSAWLPST